MFPYEKLIKYKSIKINDFVNIVLSISISVNFVSYYLYLNKDKMTVLCKYTENGLD